MSFLILIVRFSSSFADLLTASYMVSVLWIMLPGKCQYPLYGLWVRLVKSTDFPSSITKSTQENASIF